MTTFQSNNVNTNTNTNNNITRFSSYSSKTPTKEANETYLMSYQADSNTHVNKIQKDSHSNGKQSVQHQQNLINEEERVGKNKIDEDNYDDKEDLMLLSSEMVDGLNDNLTREDNEALRGFLLEQANEW